MYKEFRLMKDIINIYHPEFSKSTDLQQYGLDNPQHFKVEHLIEECMAAVGPYTFINGSHQDFSDGTDCKTASISCNPTKLYGNSYRGEIGNVETSGGGQKIGDLRCIIYNPHKDELKFYYLPRSFWANNITIHPSSKIGKIVFTYHRPSNYISKLDAYRCTDFVQLATK